MLHINHTVGSNRIKCIHTSVVVGCAWRLWMEHRFTHRPVSGYTRWLDLDPFADVPEGKRDDDEVKLSFHRHTGVWISTT